MNAWTVLLHPVAVDELNALPNDMRARFWRIVELVKVAGPVDVGMPHIRSLEGKLW